MGPLVRLATPDDAEGVLAIYAPYCPTSPVTFETETPTAGEMRERMLKVTARFPWIVAEDAGALLGYVYASSHRERAAYRWCVEVAVYVHPDARGRGVGRHLYEALFGILAAQRYVNAYAGVSLPNDASVALHEAVGFRRFAVYEGIGFKSGAWHDVAWFRKDLGERLVPPPEPRTLPSLSFGDEVEPWLKNASTALRPVEGRQPGNPPSGTPTGR